MTLNIRPSVASPTGTLIGAAVLITLAPRARPSVGPRAIARTVVWLRCWATSKIKSPSLRSTTKALKIAGRRPANSTSTTTPTIWIIVPFWLVGGDLVTVGMYKSPYLKRRWLQRHRLFQQFLE